ncbi:MAG: hypothetical protein MUC93_07030 [Bacteroidales bacterium]|jgi:hypothetical protein|nr:hypothetical protein [Bacteroidales bacterium]
MKKLKFISSLLSLGMTVAILAAGVSCTKEDETEVVPKDAVYFKEQLVQLVNDQMPLVQACAVGYNKGEFKKASEINFTKFTAAYLTALNKVLIVTDKTDVTLAELIEASKTLGSPGENFANNIWISDRRPLNDLIVPCETLNTATLVGNQPGQVPQDAKTAFTAAITKAKATRDASTTIDRLVTEGVELLTAAKTAFEAAIIK